MVGLRLLGVVVYRGWLKKVLFGEDVGYGLLSIVVCWRDCCFVIGMVEIGEVVWVVGGGEGKFGFIVDRGLCMLLIDMFGDVVVWLKLF